MATTVPDDFQTILAILKGTVEPEQLSLFPPLEPVIQILTADLINLIVEGG